MYREKKFQTNTLLHTYLLTKIFVKEKCKQEKVNRKKNHKMVDVGTQPIMCSTSQWKWSAKVYCRFW